MCNVPVWSRNATEGADMTLASHRDMLMVFVDSHPHETFEVCRICSTYRQILRLCFD